MICEKYVESKDKFCLHHIPSKWEGQAGFCDSRAYWHCIKEIVEENHLPVLSMSALKDFSSCPWRYWLRYVLGWQKKMGYKGEALKAGVFWEAFLTSSKPEYIPASGLTHAKVLGLRTAYKELEIKHPKGQIQDRRYLQWGPNLIKGIIDIAKEDFFFEIKLTTRPDWYLEPSNLALQLGTYFLMNPKWEYCVMLVTRMPELRQGKFEDIESYQHRVFMDVCRRPSYYFQGYDREKHKWGRKFYQNEFDYDIIKSHYRAATHLLPIYFEHNLWYQNRLACHVPFECDFWSACKTGVVSEEIYEKIPVREEKNGRV